MEKIKYWVWVTGMGFCMLFTLFQFELIAWNQTIDLVSGFMYKEMVITITPVHSNLVIRRETKTKVAGIVDAIYQLESSGGKNDGCIRKGLGFNGYGYNQNTKAFTCFDSHDRVKDYVTKWVNDKLEKGYSEATLLCYYNLGKIVETCPYHQSFLSLK